MAMRRDGDVQPGLIVSWSDVPRSPGHAFYDRLQTLLVDAGLDRFVEETCTAYYAPRMGAPSVLPGRYFRLLLIGYFEGIHSERGIAWRCSDSLSLREFLRLTTREKVPDHSWLSKTRSRLPHEVHDKIFGWVLGLVADHDLVQAERIGVDGSTRLGYKPEHAVDLDSGVIVAAPIHPADRGDTNTLGPTLEAAAQNLAAIGRMPTQDNPCDLVTDKGYHSREGLKGLAGGVWQSRISEPMPAKGVLRWHGDQTAQKAAYANRSRLKSGAGRRAMRKRGEMVERSFAHVLDRTGMRRAWLRGRENVHRRYLIHVAGFNLGIPMRALFGCGTPRQTAAASMALLFVVEAQDALLLAVIGKVAGETGVLVITVAAAQL